MIDGPEPRALAGFHEALLGAERVEVYADPVGHLAADARDLGVVGLAIGTHPCRSPTPRASVGHMAQVRYLVSDVDASVAFYRRLGFELVEQFGPAMAIVRREDLDLWLAGPLASAARPMPDGRQPEPGGWNRVVVTVDDLSVTVERLRADGVAFRNDVVTGPGGRQILAEDPSGNVVELFEPL